MLVDSQKRIEELRRRLDESLSLFQRQQKLGGTASSKHSNDKSRRPLTVLYQDDEQTIIQVSGPAAMNYSVDSLGVQMYRKVQNGSTSSPLQVVIGAAAGHNALTADSLPSSPAGSVDSGISSFGSSSSSPSASPGSSPVYVRGSPFILHPEDGIINQLRMRQRSTSECVASTGLKSILKKTPSSVVYNGRLARSISECQHPDEKEAIECLTSTEVLEEIDESNESLDCMTIARKKRVSFSERLVQERSFRPNSSILGQKKKNQRKSRNKLKKKTSEEVSTDDESKLGSEDRRGCSNDSISSDVIEKQESKRTANFNMLPEVDDVADPNENVGVVHENNAIDEADATVEAGTIRRRVLRSSTGEEACVTFMLGDHKLERHSNKQQSPEPNWMCFLKRQPQKNISIDKDTVEAVVEAE
uniref:Lzipper-MIP1 domain-containing protein n=1 Tax=Ascaris lumbricoides TaxID=6252 RepID=A0A0M3I4F9_ASCLU